MADRKFTRLKASLSETAAKTRENVSRELRQSLVTETENESNEDFDENFELFFQQIEENSLSIPENDLKIDVIPAHETRAVDTSGGSAFARTCCSYLTRERRVLCFSSESLFGSVFECFDDLGENALKSHVFCGESATMETKRVIRETSCVMNRMNGFLSLWKQNENCFLSFFRDRKRQQLIWSQEVTSRAVKKDANCIQIDCHCIELGADDVIDDWIEEMNENRFDAKKTLQRIRFPENPELVSKANIFGAFADLSARKGSFARLREPEVKRGAGACAVVVSSARLEVNAKTETLFSKICVFCAKNGKISQEFRFRSKTSQQRARFRLQVDDGNRNDLYLVTRVEKSSCHKQQHREPLGWSARPLYGGDGQLLRGPLSTPLFRLDANRISDEYIQSCLNNHSLMRTTIGAQLVLEVDDADCAAAAVESLQPDVQPIARFLHALFVFPLSLKYDSQRVFPKARNIECELQLRDSDAADARPLAALLCDDATTLGTSATTAVARHNANPEFNEEFLVSLPIARKEKLHLLFNFFHISCKKECTRTPVGHAWLPLRGHVTSQQVALSVFGSLPAGYLSCQALGLGKGLSMPDTRFVAKDAFKVALRLCSSLQSRDPSLEAALETFARINREESSAVRLVALESARKHLKALLSCDVTELIRFSPIILQQILELVAHSSDDDVTRASLLTLLRLVDALQHRSDVIVDFVEQTFTCDHVMDAFDERLLEALEKLLASVKEEEESKLVLRHLWFLFRIQIKAFIQRKHESARKQSQHVLRQCVSHVTHLVTKFSRSEESFAANKSLAAFLARLLSFYSLKCVFQCVDAHLKALLSRDVLLSDLRHHFLAIVLAHEHHVTINQQSPLSLALLFRELKHAFSQSVRHVRQQSVQLLRNLLAKHAFDARNANLAEVVALYTPALDILVDHMTVGDMSDDRRHARHQSLSTTRHDASSLDETKDALICVLFIAQHVTQQYVQSMSAQRVERLLVVMETAIQRFAFREETSSRAQTLPHALHAQDLRLFLSQQNLSVETAVIALRTSRLALLSQPHDDDVIRTVVKLFLALLHESQSEAIVVLAFENIALFAHDFSQQLFAFHALFSQLVAKIVEFCDCALKPIRDSGVDLLFKLFVENFKRTRFETIVCVSRLASNHAKDLTRFQASLARIQLLAEHDDEFARDSRLTQTVVRMRDILKATHRIRTESRNPYENCELRLFLANSYAQTSWSLRRTWIENLAEVHARHGDWPEYAMCLVHVIAIVVEQLRARGLHIDDARQHVSRVSPNVSRDDTRIESDDWLETEDSSHVTPEALETLIDDCADSLEKCQLFELAPHVLKVMIARFEALQNHRKLSALFQRIARMHARAAEADASGRRLFDTYFRVAHFGAQNQEYVYREAKVMSLAEMTQKLQQLHPGATIVSDCDSDCVTDSAIVVTHVTPFATHARNDFERHVNVNRFQFEQRIRRENDDDSASRVAQQYKRRVELQTSNWFPFCLKRIPVIERKETVLTPIEVAIDEMEARVKALERVTSAANDVKHLQLVLQGSVHVTVNCGPIAYAKAFLTAEPEVATEAETRLRAVFARFQDLCEKALRVNERLIKEDQKEYHVSLRTSFESFKRELDLRGDDKRTSVQIFDVISGSSLA